VQRRSFLSGLAGTGIASGLGVLGTDSAVARAATVEPLTFDSTASLLNANDEPLTDDSLIAVWGESSATNVDEDGEGDATTYPDRTDIPLVAVDESSGGAVVALGAPIVTNDTDFAAGNEEFLLNVFDDVVGSGTVLWDEGHGQFYALDKGGDGDGSGTFEEYAEGNGYALESTTDVQADLSNADALVVTSPTDAFSDAEETAVADFVANGGALFLISQSDFRNYDETANSNALANAVGAGFRFNDDQVLDDSSNGGSDFVPKTTNFNEAEFPAYFEDREGIAVLGPLDPSETYTVDVVGVSDGDTVDVQFDGGFVEPVRVLGVDTPESRSASGAERPAEWEGLSDRMGLQTVQFGSTSSLLDANGEPLTEDSLVAVHAENSATVTDENGDDAVAYGDERIPLLAIDGRVVGVGSLLVDDDALEYNANLDNEELLLNVWDGQLGGAGTVLWDETHNQYNGLDGFSTFVDYAESNGYTVQSTSDVANDLADADAVVVPSPDGAYTDTELSALADFVSNGGSLFVHDQSDYNDFDATGMLNELAAAVGAAFRFNDDQVVDPENNTGSEFRPVTSAFNPKFDVFTPREGIDQELVISDEGTPIEEVVFQEGTASLLNDANEPLTDDALVPVRAESSATNADSDGNGDAVSYPSNVDIPVVALDGAVAAIGAPFVNDDAPIEPDNEEFVLNLWDELLGGSGTVRWDEGHGQFYDLAAFSRLEAYAEENGYTVENGGTIPSDTSSVDGLVVTTPSNGFSNEELTALSSFVGDGGAVVLHDQSDYNNFDATANLNEVAAELGVGFRFNDDQVLDTENNLGQEFNPTTTNFNTSAFSSLFEKRSGVDDVQGFRDATYPYLSYHASLATTFVQSELSGETVDLSFDPVGSEFNDGVRDPFDRVLGYIEYDADGSGSRDTLYNEKLIAEGYARSYGSALSKLNTLQSAEASAQESGIGVWEHSNPSLTPTIRDDPVEELYVPKAEEIESTSGSLSGRVPVRAGSDASTADAPLVALDTANNVAMVGGLVIDEGYEQEEGFDVDTSGYGNFPFLTNIVDALADQEGDVLIEGGRGQFNADHGLSAEDAAYYQRYLEGLDIGFDAVNDVTGDGLADARALIVSGGLTGYSDAEQQAIVDFANAGGAVLFLGAAGVPNNVRDALNDLARTVGTDLRLSGSSVTDDRSNLAGDASLPVTGNFDTTFDLFSPYGSESDDDGGLPTEPGEPTIQDVLEVIEAYNNGEPYKGESVGTRDVLDVIKAFNGES
jgi:endonuclease YncB( thermonuclease family)